MKRINILESQIRLITEGMTDVTYHYCSFDSLYNILKDGDIKLTMSSNAADSYHKTKMFYLSTQRSKSTKLGYARNSKNECRIELDGYQLKADGYEAMPVDYWGASMGKQSDIGLGSSRMKIQFGERTPETQKDKEDILKSQGTSSNFEFEDRIFSDKPFMPLKYIKRIDCFTPNASSPSYMTISKSILKLAEEKNVGVFFYSNEKDFILQTNNTINGSIMTSEGQYTEEEPVKSDEYKIKRYVIELVATLCGMLFFFDAFDDELNNKTLVVLKKFGLDDFYDSVIEILPKKKMWADDLCYSMSNDIRKLNTDRFMKTKFSNIVEPYSE